MLYLFRTTEVFFLALFSLGQMCGDRVILQVAAHNYHAYWQQMACSTWGQVGPALIEALWHLGGMGKKNQMIIQSCFVCCMVKQSSSFFFFLFSFFGPWSNILLPIGTFDTASNKAKKPLSSLTDQKILRLFPHTLHMQQGLP